MAEPQKDRLRVLEQARQAAAEFACGRDGTRLAPPEIAGELGAWARELETKHRNLDEEEWLIGLLTLVCLARHRCAAGEPRTDGVGIPDVRSTN